MHRAHKVIELIKLTAPSRGSVILSVECIRWRYIVEDLTIAMFVEMIKSICNF